MKCYVLLFVSFGLCFRLVDGAQLPAVLPLPTLTPEQAVKILQTSDDLGEAEGALKVVVDNPSIRSVAIAFLDQPGLFLKFKLNWDKNNPRDSTGSPPQHWEDYYYKYIGDIAIFVVDSFSANDDPDLFKLYRHLEESSLTAWSDAVDGVESRIKPNSESERMFLDYLQDLRTNIDYVNYRTDKNYECAGIRNLRTGEFRPYLTPEQVASVKFSSEEYQARLSNRRVVSIMVHMIVNNNSALALERLRLLIASDEFWTKRIEADVMAANDFGKYALDPRMISILHQILRSPHMVDKTWLIPQLIRLSHGPDSDDLTIYDVSPNIYTPLLAFITDAEKLELSSDPKRDDDAKKYLAAAKVDLLRLYPQHGLTPPSDNELARISEAAAHPTGAATVLPTSTRPKSASLKAFPSTSMPLYAFLSALVIIGAIVFLRRR